MGPEVFMRVRRIVGAPAALALLLVTAACAAFREDTPPSPFDGGAGEENILITVDNQDWRDATLYADWNGVRQRVGMVLGKTTETFTTPWKDYYVRLDVDFVGGGGLPSQQPIQVQAGDHLDYTIMPGW
jgi:hypothetical protein